MPDHLPKATESVPAIVSFIEELVASGHAYPAGGDVYFRVASFPDYGRLSGQKPDQVEQSEEPSALKEDPRDFALWKANKPATEDTWWESPWGRGRPGWHIECSAMAEEIYGPAFEIHGGGLDLVFPHHENEVAQSRALGHPFAHIWAHNGMLRFTGEKMSKSLGNVDDDPRRARRAGGGRRSSSSSSPRHWRKPIDYSDETMAQAAARARDAAQRVHAGRAEHDESAWAGVRGRADDDFDTPAALAVLHDWASRGQLELLRRGLAVFGLESLAERDKAPPEIVELAEQRAGGAGRRAISTTSDRLRDELAAAGWEMRDRRRRLRRSCGAVTPDLVYGRRAVREALRGRREVLEVWATERTLKSEDWLDEARPKLKAERELTERAETRDHQGVLALVEPYRVRRRLRARRGREAAARRARPSDRPAEPRRRRPVGRGAGATGIVVPAHGSAVVTPAVARASAGAVEHLPIAVVTNLARYLEEVKGGALWVYGAAGEPAHSRCGRRTSPAASRSCFGAEGKGLRPLVKRMCDALVSIPLAGEIESLNVSVAAAVLLYEARRQRSVALTRPSTSSTATTSCTPEPSRMRASWSTCSRASSPSGARGAWSSSTASERTRRAGRSRFATPPHADTLLERLAAEHRDRDQVVSRHKRLDRCAGPRASRWRSSRPRRSSATSSRRSTGMTVRRASPASSTRRPGTGSNACAEASKRVHRKRACAPCGSLLYSPQPQGETSGGCRTESHLKTPEIPGVPPCPSAPHTLRSLRRRFNESLRICSSS